jgi:hypothetical protein
MGSKDAMIYKLLAKDKDREEDWFYLSWAHADTLNAIHIQLETRANKTHYDWKIIEDTDEKE